MSDVRLPDEEIRAIARGLLTGEYMLADLEDPSWQTSLTLLLSLMASESSEESPFKDIVAVIVPRAPHAGGRWLNGVAPGVTVEARLLDRETWDRVVEAHEPMRVALYGDEEADDE